MNHFNLLSPAAAESVPAHDNEVGLMAEGEIRAGTQGGLNYAPSVGNGVPGFEVTDAVRGTAFDANGNRTVTGRLGIVYQPEGGRLEVGFSGAGGTLRTGEDASFATGEVRRYGADFSA